MTDRTFNDRHVLVTGGGSGIGRGAALAFAEQGAASVIIAGRRRDRLEQVAAEHPAIVPVEADITTDQGREAILAAVKAAGGTLDVLVHNAGVYRWTPLDYCDVDAAREMLEINLIAPFLLTTQLLPMLRSPGASIVLVSSVAGHNPEPYASLYAVSKAGFHSYTVSWAKELAARGIRVNAVAPSAVRTEVYDANGLTTEQIDALFAKFTASSPLGRTGEVPDVTPWITQLASPTSSWVTGQVITIDGGADLTSAADSYWAEDVATKSW